MAVKTRRTASAIFPTPSSARSSPSSPPRTAPAPRPSRPGGVTYGAPPLSTSTTMGSLSIKMVSSLASSSPPTRDPSAASASRPAYSSTETMFWKPGSNPPLLDNLQELEFYVLRKYVSLSHAVLSASVCRFSSTLRVATISQCHISDDTVETLRFPQLRKLAIVNVKISEVSLHRIIATSCPVLECLLLSYILDIPCLRINSPTLRSIGIRRSSEELIIEDAPSLERLLHLEICNEMQILVISVPKLETLGCISDWYGNSKVVFGSTIIQGLRIDNLTTVVGTVKILDIHMLYFDLDMLIGLMRCFPCLEKLYMERSRSGKKNLWRRKHLNFLRSHEIRLKTIVMGVYQGIQAQFNFASFFVLNARMLESIRLEVAPDNYNEEFFAEQHRMLQMEKRASRGARLCFTTICRHGVHIIYEVSDLDLTDPFACGC